MQGTSQDISGHPPWHVSPQGIPMASLEQLWALDKSQSCIPVSWMTFDRWNLILVADLNLATASYWIRCEGSEWLECSIHEEGDSGEYLLSCTKYLCFICSLQISQSNIWRTVLEKFHTSYCLNLSMVCRKISRIFWWKPLFGLAAFYFPWFLVRTSGTVNDMPILSGNFSK